MWFVFLLPAALFEKKIHTNSKADVWVYSGAGKLITILKGIAKDAVFMCFTLEEDMLVVEKEGNVTIFDYSSCPRKTFSIDPEVRESGVAQCQQFFTLKPAGSFMGLVILTSSNRFFLMPDIRFPDRVQKLATIPGISSPPSSWCVIPDARDSRVVAAVERSVCILTSRECTPVLVDFSGNQFKEIHQMTSSLCGTDVAFLTDTGILWFGSVEESGFNKRSEFNTQSKSKASQLLCAGTAAVVGLWKDVLLAVGDDKTFFNFIVERPAFLVQEVDGLRIITNTTHELLQQVPDVVNEIYQIGSIAPGSLLLEARKEFDRKSHKADEYLKLLRDGSNLENAVLQCIEAAGHEYPLIDQKVLLHAARLGKTLTPSSNRDEFVDMCQKLRVLNSLRAPDIGMPLTHNQLNFMGIRTVIDRLIGREAYATASSIAEYLQIPQEEGCLRIIRAWASQKVRESGYDAFETAAIIYKKLSATPVISYAEIATEAVDRGRKELAVKLLEYETRASEQVPLLLKLDQHRLAIDKAVASGDSHLLFTVLHRLKNTFPENEFLSMIRSYPIPFSLYQRICKDEDADRLRQIFREEEDFVSEGSSWIEHSLKQDTKEAMLQSLQSALSSFKKAKSDFAIAATEEQIKLLKLQFRLKEKNRIDCVSSSITDTLRAILVAREYKVADEFRKEFKVSDKRFWWTKIAVESSQGNWAEMEKFSRSKKSPIGYEVNHFHHATVPLSDCLILSSRLWMRVSLTTIGWRPRNMSRKWILLIVSVTWSKWGESQQLYYHSVEIDITDVTFMIRLLQEAAEFASENNDIEGMDFVISKSGPTQRSRIEPLRVKLMQRK
jgi:hypothetical protein